MKPQPTPTENPTPPTTAATREEGHAKQNTTPHEPRHARPYPPGRHPNRIHSLDQARTRMDAFARNVLRQHFLGVGLTLEDESPADDKFVRQVDALYFLSSLVVDSFSSLVSLERNTDRTSELLARCAANVGALISQTHDILGRVTALENHVSQLQLEVTELAR